MRTPIIRVAQSLELVEILQKALALILKPLMQISDHGFLQDPIVFSVLCELANFGEIVHNCVADDLHQS